MTKMTEEQRKLAEENIDLAFRVLRYKARRLPSYKAIGIEADDILEIAFLALCKAAMTFDADKGYKFSTWFTAVFDNEVKLEIRKINAESRKANLLCDSLDAPIRMGNEMEPLLLRETIPSKQTAQEELMDRQCVREDLAAAVNGLPEEQRELVVLHYIDNVPQYEIGRKIGCSQPAVWRRLKKAITRIQGALEDKGMIE